MMGLFWLVLLSASISSVSGLRGKPLPNVGFAFRGYHLAHGNPLATQVASDPGFAGQIFEANYSNNLVSADLQYSIPAGIQVFNKGGCSQAVNSDVIETSEEYGDLLKSIVKTDYTGFDSSFKASSDYNLVHTKTTGEPDSKFLLTQMLCVAYEAVLETNKPPQLTKDFRDGALSIISHAQDTPEQVNAKIHVFLKQYGTHYIKKLDMGSRYTFQNHLTSAMQHALVEEGITPKMGARLSVSKQLGGKLSQEELVKSRLFDQITASGAKSSSFVGGTGGNIDLAKKNPIPLFYEVERLDNMFKKSFMKNANLNYKEIKKRLGLYFMNYCENELKITGTNPCLVTGTDRPINTSPSKSNFKVILPARVKDEESNAPDYRQWETDKVKFELSPSPPNFLTWKKKVKKPLQEVTVSWWMKTSPYADPLTVRRTVLSYYTPQHTDSFKIEVNPELSRPASGGISVWLGGRRITSDDHYCPIPVDGQFHHYVFSWSVVYGRWQVYIDGNIVEGGTDTRKYVVPSGGWMVVGQDQISNVPSAASFQGEVAYLNIWDQQVNGVEARRLSIRPDLQGNIVAWSQDGWKCTGPEYDVEILLDSKELYKI